MRSPPPYFFQHHASRTLTELVSHISISYCLPDCHHSHRPTCSHSKYQPPTSNLIFPLWSPSSLTKSRLHAILPPEKLTPPHGKHWALPSLPHRPHHCLSACWRLYLALYIRHSTPRLVPGYNIFSRICIGCIARPKSGRLARRLRSILRHPSSWEEQIG